MPVKPKYGRKIISFGALFFEGSILLCHNGPKGVKKCPKGQKNQSYSITANFLHNLYSISGHLKAVIFFAQWSPKVNSKALK